MKSRFRTQGSGSELSKRPLKTGATRTISVKNAVTVIAIDSPTDASASLDAEQMCLLLKHLKDVVFQTDAEGRWTYLNPAWTEITGWAVQESLGRRFLDSVHPDDREDNLRKFLPLLAREKESCRHEVRYLRKDAEPCWMEVHARLTLDEEGRIVGTSGTLSDVSARRAAESRLRAREALHSAMMASSPMGILIAEGDRVLTANDRFAELTQAGDAAAIRSGTIPLSDIGRAFEQQAAEGAEHLLSRFGDARREVAMRSGRVFSICRAEVSDAPHGRSVDLFRVEDVTAIKDAERVLHLAKARLEEHVEQRTRQLADANRRLRQSEQLYRTVIETSPDALLFVSLEGRIEIANLRAAALFGYESAESMAGSAIEQIVEPASADLFRSAWQETLAGRSPDCECRLRRRDGSVFYGEVTGSTVPDPAGGSRFAVIDIRDNTPRRQLEEQLLQSQKMDAIGRLAGGVAHDFNNLLTVIKGYSELLLRKLPATDAMAGRVLQISKASDRAAALVGQLLAFSRKQPAEERVVDVNRAITDLHKMLRRLIGENIAIRSELDPGAGSIRIDPTHFDQMIINLAVNARDAIPESGSITIRTAQGASGPVISISDNGIGMSEEVKSKMFEPFFTTKETGKGTGLGLSTVYGIVHQAGGTISVTTAPGAGTRFELSFPAASSQHEESNDGGAGDSEQGEGTILVAEDEELVRAMIVETLRERGYRVLEASDGMEAIEIVRRKEPVDLVLTDIVMPVFGGMQVRNEILRLRPESHVLLMSGYPESGVPADQWLQKPFEPRTLCERVRKTLHRSQQSS